MSRSAARKGYLRIDTLIFQLSCNRRFHTGDLGKLDADGFLSITGRLKEQYKLENGKYVCPTPIEEAIGMSRFISQVVVCGDNRPFNVALVVPDWTAIRSELRLADDLSEEDLVNNDKVKGLLSAEIKLNCYSIKKFEVPQSFSIVSPFTAANNMLTPKVSCREDLPVSFSCISFTLLYCFILLQMSIRRHVVIKTYEDLISELYDGQLPRRQDDLDAA